MESEPALEEQQAQQATADLMEMEVVEEEIRKSPPPAELDDVPVTQEAAAQAAAAAAEEEAADRDMEAVGEEAAGEEAAGGKADEAEEALLTEEEDNDDSEEGEEEAAGEEALLTKGRQRRQQLPRGKAATVDSETEMEKDKVTPQEEDDLAVGMIIQAQDATVVKKGLYGKITSIEEGKQYGTVEWEVSNGGRKLHGPKEKPERVAFEGRFKYSVEDESELEPIALRSGLPAVANLFGVPLLHKESIIVRNNSTITHMISDFGLLQSGTFIAKQAGMLSGFIYTDRLRVAMAPNQDESYSYMPSSAESDAGSESPDVVAREFETRMNVGDIFFEYKGINSAGMIPSAGIEEMYMYVGVAEEYNLQKPTLPADDGVMRSVALLGYRFKRCRVGSAWQLCWRQGSDGARAIEKDNAAMTLSALRVTKSSRLYVVSGCTPSIFGTELSKMFSKVLSTSTLFAPHREHSLWPTEPLMFFRRMSRGALVSKPTEDLKRLLTSVFASAFYSIAENFRKKFESLRKASPSTLEETCKELITANSSTALFLRKHVLWLLNKMNPSNLKELMREIDGSLCELESAARASLTLPDRANALLQDEIAGGREMAGGNGGKARKNRHGDKDYSPTKPPPGAADGGKKPRGSRLATSLDDLLSNASRSPNTSEHSPGLVDSLAAKLANLPSMESITELRQQVSKLEIEKGVLQTSLSKETLRAESEKGRAQQEKGRADVLQRELTDLRKGLDRQSINAAASFAAAGTSGEADTSQVTALKDEIKFLRKQNGVLLLLLGGQKADASSLLQKADPPAS